MPMSSLSGSQLAHHWLASARRPDIASQLQAIFNECADAIAARGPTCWASGRCCNFEQAGHLLYVTGLEAAFTLANFNWLRPVQSNALKGHAGGTLLTLTVAASPLPVPSSVTPAQLLASLDKACPFQAANLCGVHTIKPLGCRIYFCDKSAQDWQQALHEKLLTNLRALHDHQSIEYRYGEWRSMLKQILTAMSE